MRVRSLIAAIAVSGLITVGQVSAQQAQPQAAAPTQAAGQSRLIGVIDIGHILQNHPTLKTKMEGIKSQMEAADKEMQTKREGIIKQMDELKARYNEGTAEYDKAEKAIADQDTTFRLELVKRRKEFESAQAVVLYEVHSQISTLLDHLSKNHGFQVILQVSRQPVDPKKPETLDMAMSQNVMYYNKGIDVTDWVLSALQQQLGTGAASTAPAASTGAAPGGAPLR